MPIPSKEEFEKLLRDAKVKNETLRNVLLCLYDAASTHAREMFEQLLSDPNVERMDDGCRKLYVVGVPLSMLGLCKDGKPPMEFCSAATACVAIPTQSMSMKQKMKLMMEISKLVAKINKCMKKAEKKKKWF